MNPAKPHIRFSLPGPPVGKQRARVTPHGTYTPTKTKRYEESVAWAATEALQHADRSAWPTAERCYLDVYIHYADNNIKKPDPDNVIKAIADGLSGILFVKWTGRADDFRVWPRVQHVTEKDAAPRVDCLVTRV